MRTTTRRNAAAAMGRLAQHAPRVVARIDQVSVRTAAGFGGAMNGQRGRRDITRAIVQALRPDAVVETGTFRGTTTEFLLAISGAEVHSVELMPRFYEYSRRRLAHEPQVHLVQGDSVAFLTSLPDRVPRNAAVFVYLDAHWEGHLPVHQELELILRQWPRSVTLVDDFQVPGDPGYGYDDYGPGAALSEEVLGRSGFPRTVQLYPTLASSAETGARRGCVVIAPEELAGSLIATGLLRATS